MKQSALTVEQVNEADESPMERLMLRLPSEYRTVFILRNVIGYSLEDIARMLLLPVREVNERLNRGGAMLCRLKKRLSVVTEEDAINLAAEEELPLRS